MNNLAKKMKYKFVTGTFSVVAAAWAQFANFGLYPQIEDRPTVRGLHHLEGVSTGSIPSRLLYFNLRGKISTQQQAALLLSWMSSAM